MWSPLLLFFILVLFAPNIFTDPENFLNANPLVTPIHIQPEWYFLWLYAILRSIPNKLGGVIALAIALIILVLPAFTFIRNKIGSQFNPLSQFLFWTIVASWLILTWIGARPVEEPYVIIGQVATLIYFSYFLLNPILIYAWDSLLKAK